MTKPDAPAKQAKGVGLRRSGLNADSDVGELLAMPCSNACLVFLVIVLFRGSTDVILGDQTEKT